MLLETRLDHLADLPERLISLERSVDRLRVSMTWLVAMLGAVAAAVVSSVVPSILR